MITTENERCRLGEFATWFNGEEFFQTYSEIPQGWTEEEPEAIPISRLTARQIDRDARQIETDEQPETLPDESPGVPEPPANPARHSVRSEVADGIVLTGYAQCTFDEFPDLTPDDREDIRQDLATGLCVMADRAIASGRTPRIRRDILRLTRDRLVARKRKESTTLPYVAVADEHAAAEAREALETLRMSRQANAWRLHLVEMERLNQMQPAMTGTRLL